jgi:hypothetical protein
MKKKATFDPNADDLYGGISAVQLPGDKFELGQGVTLERTFAHMMAPHMMAFAPAPTGKAHPPPWVAVQGSRGADIYTQLFIPKEFSQADWFDRLNTAWWLTSLLRLRVSPSISMPVIADRPFASMREDFVQPHVIAIEGLPSRTLPVVQNRTQLGSEDLLWLKDNWIRGGRLMNAHKRFNAAYQAFDFSSHAGSVALAMLTIWGALEELFSHAKQELRFRISASIASYVEDRGPRRLAFHKKVQRLYDARSAVAHSAGKGQHDELVESYAILRGCLLRMIESGMVPEREDLEKRVFE